MPEPDPAIVDALRRLGLVDADAAPAMTPLTGGVSSDIWRVDLPGGPVCVKRALAKLKVDAAWEAPVERSRYEWAWMREAARVVRGQHVAPHVRALAVPGSKAVRQAAESEGLHEVFLDAGFEWRGAGCSMCLAMNPDRLNGREVCASSSNRNFKGRQGSPTGRTLLMSPAMVAAAAVSGEVTDVRQMLG